MSSNYPDNFWSVHIGIPLMLCWCYVYAWILHNETVNLYHLYCIETSSAVINVGINHHTMKLQSLIFPLEGESFWLSSPLSFFLWWASNASQCRSSLSTFMGCLLHLGQQAPSHIGLWNSIIAKLRRPAPIGIKHIYNKANCMYLLVPRHFNRTFNKFYTCFHLPIALLVVCWCNCLLYVHLSAKIFECLKC